MDPAEGERRAAIGFAGQYGLAARIVYDRLSTLEWIHLADPDAGIADDFQFKAGATRHALQVKWAQYPESFTWSALTSTTASQDALLAGLARAWAAIRTTWDGPLVVHLCTNGQPSVSPPAAGSVLASATANGPKHLAAFLARSFRPAQRAVRDNLLNMGALRSLEVFTEWESVWTELKRVSSLGDDDFLRFVEDLEFDFGVGTLDEVPSTVDGALDLQTKDDLRILASELQACVADPARPRRIDRAELLHRLGWETRLRYRNRHEFPVPGTYTPNQAATRALHDALTTLDGGYLALVGPAGSGKSTLLSDIAIEGRVVRYYAFIPDSPNPLGHRGEAESFLNDLALALEEAGIFRSGQPSGLPGLRYCISQQLARAQEAWSARGEKTVIIIDGLDHITREQNPSRSMLEELPAPASLGDGVFVVLGSQTTTIASADIRGVLSRPGRTITLPPLAHDEVRKLAEQAGLIDWLRPGQIDTLIEVTEGHPLAATYLLGELSSLSATPGEELRRVSAERILADASNYGGDVELRYRGYFQAVRADAEVVALLASVARLRTSLSLRWLSSWASAEVVNRFVSDTKTFFRVADDEWQFVHNSFRRFLADETARIDGSVSEGRNRDLHLDLADRCAGSGDAWPTYRDEEIAHRYLAGDDHLVLTLVTPAAMRARLRALQAAPVIQDHTSLGLRAAARSGDNTAFVRLTLFTAELAQREHAFSAEQLAIALADLTPAASAIDYVVRGSRVRIAANTAAAIAASWAEHGHSAAAAGVLNALGGITALTEARVSRSGEADGLTDWAIATFHVSGLDAVLTHLERHLPLPKPRPSSLQEASENVDQAPRDWRLEREDKERRHQRLEVLAACFDELLEVRDFANLDGIGARIDAEGDLGWQARGRLMRALTAAADGDAEEAVAQIRKMLELGKSSQSQNQDGGTRVPLGFRLRAAVALLSLGLSDSETFRALIGDDERPIIKDDPGHEPDASYRQVLDLETVRHYLALVRPGDAPGRPSHAAADDSETAGRAGATEAAGRRPHDAARKRFLDAVVAAARLRAEAIAAREGVVDSPAVAGRAAEVIQVIEVPRQITNDWHGWYRVREAFPSLMAHVIHLAHRVGGSAELLRLTGVLDRAWSGQRASYWSVELRHAALEQFATLDQSSHDWIQRKLEDIGSLITERSYDPQSQVEAWLKHAEIRSSLRQRAQALDAVATAVDASLGLGMTDDDEQLAQWFGWLTTAKRCSAISEREYLAAIDRFATRLPGAARIDERAAATAAERLVRECWQVSPMHAYRVGSALTDIGVLPEVDLITSALLGALDTNDNRASQLSILVATEMLLPVSGSDRESVIERLRATVRDADRDTIDRSMQTWGLVEATEESDRKSAPEQIEESRDDSADQESPGMASTPVAANTPPTAAALLGLLRRLPDGSEYSDSWWNTAAITAYRDPIPLNVARALVQELGRLRATEDALGLACGALAAAGEPEVAREALQVRLARLPSSGWFRHYDGGTRRKLFAGALRSGAPAIARLALSDLAETLAGDRFAWTRLADDVRQVLELVAGPQAVGAAWSNVDTYLEIVAPVDSSFREASIGPRTGAVTDSSAAALAAMVGDFLGHPAKAPEEGARRTFIRLLTSGAPEAASRTAVLAALEDAVERGGWPAESALTVLLLSAPDDAPATLVAAVQRATAAEDQILRDLARRICSQWGQSPVVPAKRDLSPLYGMQLPPLPIHQPPEVDADGVSFIDLDDPQQVVAPFNNLLEALAEMAELPESAVMYRASQLALTETGDPWTDRGNRAMADRLKRRGQQHTYRPWAYLVGRRAAGRVLADLTDAGLVDGAYPAFAFDLLAPDLLRLEAGPLPDSIPRPWRPATVSSYDTRGWCGEAQEALEHYRVSLASEPDFVLAEVSDWGSLEWGLPREERRLDPVQFRGLNSAGLPVRAPAIEQGGTAYWYPNRAHFAWRRSELLVRGFEMLTNAPFLRWIAFHPSAAEALDWEPLEGQRFGWRGSDGGWRARTDYSVRGLLSHNPPAHSYVAEVWRVVLSQRGREEVEDRFGSLVRRLTVTRIQPASRREGTPEQRMTVRRNVEG
ncbi:hypothetical protein O2W15_11295 [Modestobacter sp. VKM Ac-2979]|uniref:hypothetical protein n=1 Tax=unclassified Modestobacter TaxID=2643866 RepID=UPI0022AB5EAC|nr:MULTISPECIES: hypothetical protein [unclassified Modestobacter]MCZ2812019.1 hypothetical protein [Modestobacter sp. VKM Ac-2979]MCZ2843743.1 hypothetical protein [Modestobacter sp. VKM Ac-2980]